MNDQLKHLVATCVEKNTVFAGQVGTNYTVQELLHQVSNKTIDMMYQGVKKNLSALDETSLFKTSNSSRKAELQLQADTLAGVFEYKKEQAENAAKAKEVREANQKKLAHLKNLKTEKEMEALGKLTPEELEKEIAALEG